MKKLTQYINEYLIKKKINKVRDNYEYFPNNKKQLIKVIDDLIKIGNTDFGIIDTSKIEDMSNLFVQFEYRYPSINLKDTNICEWNVSNVKNMSYMFSGCKKFDCDLSNWDVHNVENMSFMFSNCKSFTSKGIENWNVSSVENMSAMFYNCEKLDCDLSNWMLFKIKDLNSMFSGCVNFTGKGLENWDVGNAEVMSYMFDGCKNFDCDLSNWDVSNVEYMNYMFSNCKKFKGTGLENWNASKAQHKSMFYGCKSIKKPSWIK